MMGEMEIQMTGEEEAGQARLGLTQFLDRLVVREETGWQVQSQVLQLQKREGEVVELVRPVVRQSGLLGQEEQELAVEEESHTQLLHQQIQEAVVVVEGRERTFKVKQEEAELS
tara:strand:- start:507 stop:848 length:342 start_codon:yes stop_codon:yes gene_type:complete